MTYRILLSKKAQKQLSKILKGDQRNIVLSIENLTVFSDKSKNIKRLKTPFPGYRKRIGSYRILFEVIVKENEIKIYKIGHRGDIYKK